MSCGLHCLLCLLCVCLGVCGAMNLQGHKVHLACGGALLKCGSLKEMRRVSNASDLESTPATAAFASIFAAWGCFAAACCLLLAAALLLLGVLLLFPTDSPITGPLVIDQASLTPPGSHIPGSLEKP